MALWQRSPQLSAGSPQLAPLQLLHWNIGLACTARSPAQVQAHNMAWSKHAPLKLHGAVQLDMMAMMAQAQPLHMCTDCDARLPILGEGVLHLGGIGCLT